MSSSLRTRFTWALCAFLLVLAGCAPVSTRRAEQADRILALTTSQRLTCDRADRCADPSPFLEQANKAIAESRDGQPHNFVTLLNIGQNALAARINLIRAARSSIVIQTYIWKTDDAGMLMLDELVRAARRGVKVRILADGLNSLNDVALLARLARVGRDLQIRIYNPVFGSAAKSYVEDAASVVCCFRKFNERMHNKLFLVDGKVGIVGGRNYADDYYDWDSESDYLDRDVIVAGTAAQQMAKSFELYWRAPRAVPITRLRDVNADILAHPFETATWTAPRFADPQRVAAVRADAEDPGWLHANLLDHTLAVGLVDYFYDLPSMDKAVHGPHALQLDHFLVDMLAGARHQIVLQTPYLILTRRARKVFKALHQRDPRVQVIVSTDSLASTDAVPVYAMSYKHHKKYLVDYGFQIHELMPHPGDEPTMLADFNRLSGIGSEKGSRHHGGQAPITPTGPGPRMHLHAKSLVVDGRIAMVGSHNLDPRSFHINTEDGVIIANRAFAQQVRAAILRDAAPQNSWLVAPRRPGNVIGSANVAIGDFFRKLPVFDVWPWAYATDYQLRPGGKPVPATSPEFLDNWEPVGDFPDVALSLTSIITRFIVAFGEGLGIQGIL